MLQLGDVVLSVNGSSGSGHEETTKLLKDAVGEVTLLLQRKGKVPTLPKEQSGSSSPAQLASAAPLPTSASRDAEPPPPSFEAAQQMESDALAKLEAMGFGSEESKKALREAQGDPAAAVALLTDRS